MVNFPCSVCEKPVGINHEAVCCDKCNKWVHIRCKNICKKAYGCLKKDPTPWYCKLCIGAKLPFSKLNNTEFDRLTKNRTIIYKKKKKIKNPFLSLKSLTRFLKMKTCLVNITITNNSRN